MPRLLFSRTGPPLEVLELAPQPQPMPGPGELLIRMIASPVNPADLNFIEGSYGKKPELPAACGMEGCGIIEAVGPGVTGFAIGAPVLPLVTSGNWASWRLLAPEQIAVLPEGIDPLQAALLRVNPPTAWGLLHAAGPPLPGQWIVQNAASSAAGHCVIQVARQLGLRTLNFVRRAESVAACGELGADLVFTDDAAGLAAAKAALAGTTPPALALNAVGGDSALRLLDLLAPQGTHVTYGAMSRQALKVPNGLLIFKGLTLRGFWLSQWHATLDSAAKTALQQRLAAWVRDGRIRQQIAATYPVESWPDALRHAAGSARNGKVLLTF